MRKIRLIAPIFIGLVLQAAAQGTLELKLDAHKTIRFVAFGDTRFHDPADVQPANPAVRQALVKAIAHEKPDFISIGGDIVYNGNDVQDWETYDQETSIWKSKNLHVFPVLGNHDLHGDLSLALSNYFQRYPELEKNRFYSVRDGRLLVLNLDSSFDEVAGPQGEWIKSKLDSVPNDVAFVLIVMHHPPNTSSTDDKSTGGGHAVRPQELAFAHFLEDEQSKLSARIVVFAGHVHNYDRHQVRGVTYFVTGGGGAHAYPIQRMPGDPFQSHDVNYHYLKVKLHGRKMKITMRRLELQPDGAHWSEPDSTTLEAQSLLK
jgi:Icc-related predicted phosphoesterase